jgi:glutathione S-transferase
MTLVIGNKTYSSWSLRPWLLMKYFKIPFEEILIKLDTPTTTLDIQKYSPSSKVPTLIDEKLIVWESLAIMEYLNEKFPDLRMYPEDIAERALARSVSSEMHSGFLKIRQNMSFHAKRKFEDYDLSPALKEIERVKDIWTERLEESKGPFLFGEFSIADAMYAPMVGRFITYGVPTDGLVKEYCEDIMNLSAMKEWYDEANKEIFIAKDHIK